MGRSPRLPLGSPPRPVPPPTSTIGRPPSRCSHASSITGSRLPTWSESAVGSKPTYPVIGPVPSRSASAGVASWIRPRSVRTARGGGIGGNGRGGREQRQRSTWLALIHVRPDPRRADRLVALPPPAAEGAAGCRRVPALLRRAAPPPPAPA